MEKAGNKNREGHATPTQGRTVRKKEELFEKNFIKNISIEIKRVRRSYPGRVGAGIPWGGGLQARGCGMEKEHWVPLAQKLCFDNN